jgi:hypothetical protein
MTDKEIHSLYGFTRVANLTRDTARIRDSIKLLLLLLLLLLAAASNASSCF